MTFDEILKRLVEETPGAEAAAIMDGDGMPVEVHRAPGARVDLPALAVEFQKTLQEASKAIGALDGEGGPRLLEMTLATGTHQLHFQQLDAEYFLVAALGPRGWVGKMRWLVQGLLHELREEL
ncbi:MAG: roadblock/LC7 domain-containing protein [Myxococcota bacterium]